MSPNRRDRPLCLSVKIVCLICSLVFIAGCSSTGKVRVAALNAPGGSNPEAASAVKAGNQAFAAGQWAAAKQHYEKAIGVQKTLAEAHYNSGPDPGPLGTAQASRGALYRSCELRSRTSGHLEFTNLSPVW